MLRIIDAGKLAYTKLRTRKLRLFISLLVSSLLFAGLVGGSLVVTGALASLDAFSQEGFSNRYLVVGIATPGDNPYAEDKALIARAEELEKQNIAAKKAAAKELGIFYAADEISSDAVYIDETNGSKQLNFLSVFAQKAIAEKEAKEKNTPSLKKFMKQVPDAAHYYSGVSMSWERGNNIPTLALIKNGKEQRGEGANGAGGPEMMMDGNSAGLQTVTHQWNLLDDALLEPFLLKGQNLKIGSDGSLPIVASYSAAQEVLQLSSLPKDATATEKKERLEKVRQRIAGQTFQLCYRNHTSTTRYEAAVSQQEEIKKNAGKSGFVQSDLVYKPAGKPCREPVIVRDVRSSEDKLYQERQEKFDQQFGELPPRSRVLTFRIVGLAQDSPFADNGAAGGNPLSATEIIAALTASSLSARWVSPMSVLHDNAAVEDVFAKPIAQPYGSQEVYFAEYPDPAAARQVLTTKTCQLTYEGPGASAQTTGVKLPACTLTGPASFSLQPFGSASLAVDDFKSAFRTFQLWAVLAIGVVAAIILMGIIGRIIADARKETAVFRATGATRFMISQVYFAYTLYLSLLMIGFAVVLGFGFALWVNSLYGPEASVNMALLYNVSDLSKQFTFYGLDAYDIALIALTVTAAAFVSAIVPIAHNLRRNPIRDMRDE